MMTKFDEIEWEKTSNQTRVVYRYEKKIFFSFFHAAFYYD